MERTYAAWTKGVKPEDVELIKHAMAREKGAKKVGWGGRIIRPEDGPHPFGAGHGAFKRATAQTD